MIASTPWRCHLARSLFMAAGLTMPVSAQLDTNANGMSDVWERHFHNGQLFDPENPAHHPEADPDADGWSNLQEATAGTDPFSGKPPYGIVPTHMTRLVDVAIISWDTLPGKHYTLTTSPDLTAESWITVGDPIAGDGQPAALGITLTDTDGEVPAKLFWRVNIEDPQTDSDGDGLTDYEEYLLGSNPFDAHTTNTGIPDGWIAQHLGHIPGIFQIFDPNAETAGGGGTLLESMLSGADPNEPSSEDLPIWTAISTGDTDDETPVPPAPRQRTITIPAGTSAIIAIAAASAEFSEWTDPTSANTYNDTLAWDIQVTSEHYNLSLVDGLNVNSLHGNWITAHNHSQMLPGLVNVAHFVVWKPVHAPATEDLTVTITLNATNVGDNRLASDLAVGVLPMRAYDNVLGTGVDDLSNTANPGDVGYQEDVWIMAPQQGGTLPKENLTQFSLGGLGGLVGNLHCGNATPDPAAFALDGNYHNITWRGGAGDGVEDEAIVEIQLGAHPQKYPLGVRVKAMKHRTVNVKAIRVTHANGRAFPDDSELNFNTLQSKVNEYLAYQLNAWMHFDLKNETFIYDTPSTLVMVDSPPGSIALDIHDFLGAARFQADANHDLVVIFIDDINFVHGPTGLLILGHAPLTLLDLLDLPENVCFVLVRERNDNTRILDEIAFTTAHEIGHILLGEGHPDAPAGHPGGHGPAWLQGTTLVGHRKRLMCSGNHYILGHSRMLVKAEWDKAEQWLIGRPRGDQ